MSEATDQFKKFGKKYLEQMGAIVDEVTNHTEMTNTGKATFLSIVCKHLIIATVTLIGHEKFLKHILQDAFKTAGVKLRMVPIKCQGCEDCDGGKVFH